MINEETKLEVFRVRHHVNRRKWLLVAAVALLIAATSCADYATNRQRTLEEQYPDIVFPEVSYVIVDAAAEKSDQFIAKVKDYRSTQSALIIRNVERLDDATIARLSEITRGWGTINQSLGVSTILVVYFGGKLYHLYNYETNEAGFSAVSDEAMLKLLQADLEDFVKSSLVIDLKGEIPDSP